jgi:hypothetical protein
MEVRDFGSALELAKYVNDNSILQTKVVTVRWVNGRWWLFYYV